MRALWSYGNQPIDDLKHTNCRSPKLRWLFFFFLFIFGLIKGATVQHFSLTIRAPCRNLFSTQHPSTRELHLHLQRFAHMTPSQGNWFAGALQCPVHQPTSTRQDLCCSLIPESSLVSGTAGLYREINNILWGIMGDHTPCMMHHVIYQITQPQCNNIAPV